MMTHVLAALAAVGDADPNTPGVQASLMTFFVTTVLPVLLSVAGAVVVNAGVKFSAWMKAKTHGEMAGTAIGKAGEIAGAALADALADVGPRLQAAAADGVLTRSELASISTDAAAKMVATLGAKGLEAIRAGLGIADVNAYVRGKIILEAQAMGAEAAAEITTVEQAAAELSRP